MGSTGCMGVGKGYAAANDFLVREVSQDASKGTSFEVLKSSFVGSTWYAAVKVQTPPQPAYVIALIFKTCRRGGEFIYKDMEESMGPCEVDCPASIMKLLTPIEELERLGVSTSYAAEWRANVKAAAEKRAMARKSKSEFIDGQVVRFPNPLSFNKGKTMVDVATVRHFTRRNRRKLGFIAHENGDFLFRVRPGTLDGIIVVKNNEASPNAAAALVVAPPKFDPVAFLRGRAEDAGASVSAG